MKLKLLIAAGAMAAATGAIAQQPAASPEMQAARAAVQQSCAADMKTLCDGKEGREAMVCLMRDNADKVSAGCKDAMAKMRAARQAAAPQ